jgi:uncharacterized MAPEG superfamily protein
MTISLICLFIAIILPMVPRTFVAKAQSKTDEGYNNALPREQQKNLDALGQRALGAHLNSFEALQMFTAAIVIAHLSTAPQVWVDRFSILFIVSRLLFIFAYIKDLPSLRSSVWFLGFLATLLVAGSAWIK